MSYIHYISRNPGTSCPLPALPRRNHPMRTPALYYYALSAFWIVSRFVGIGHAADLSLAAGNATGSIERNGAKEFPFRNLSAHRTITGMTPASFAGNRTHKFTGANATIFLRGAQQNGTMFHPTVNGSGLIRNGTRMKANLTARTHFPDHRIVKISRTFPVTCIEK